MGDNISLNIKCNCCGENNGIKVRLRDYSSWKYNGLSINQAFPYLKDEDKDLLLTGICSDCLTNTYQRY